eukprot:CAMPEP_0178495686 /NCGR_PEP_ID=MMETSP0696-20121128/13683_1 /TAXON_ID=265572 /ORGANISM="Extubocellulus spinifer, Strain CCMP396" /LENGTH=327 /DNA_ID=CAMNT_0020123853 /DNA_START=20 /DNA_END=1003 /DNA_ORIENTATION=-
MSSTFVRLIARRCLPAGGATVAGLAACAGERGSCRVTSRATSKLASPLHVSLLRQQPKQLHVRRVLSPQNGECRNLSSAKIVNPPAPTSAAGAGAAPSATAASGTTGFVAWYEKFLDSSPVKTKMVTGAILWGLGDVVAQVVPHFVFDDKDSPPASAPADDSEGDDVVEKSVPTTSSGSSAEFTYDFPRTARAAIFGFAIHAPLSHVHYNFLERLTIKAGLQGLSIPVFKTVMEQFVYWSWFSNSLYHGTMGAMQGWTAQQCYDRIADVLWETQKAQWVFWIPVQLLNFQFVPVRHQLNVVLLTSVVWTALLSAWYPPPKEEKEEVQ